MEDVPQPTQKSVESDHLATDQNQLSVDNGLLQMNFSTKTGRLESLFNRQAGVAANVTFDISAYISGKPLHHTVAAFLLLLPLLLPLLLLLLLLPPKPLLLLLLLPPPPLPKLLLLLLLLLILCSSVEAAPRLCTPSNACPSFSGKPVVQHKPEVMTGVDTAA